MGHRIIRPVQIERCRDLIREMTVNDLRRYWFKSGKHFGIGVTAFSRADAEFLVKKADLSEQLKYVTEVIENVDIRNLDQGHVIPNMSPPNFRGVWFPQT
ncbi:MAG: hypothetical protein R2681_04255 [Pyrinomonadaceae bacterium]